MDTLQKYAEAKRSGLHNVNGTHDEAKQIVEEHADPVARGVSKAGESYTKQPPRDFKPVSVEPTPSHFDGPFPWETPRWVVWTQVIATMLTLVAVGYVIWLLHQNKPAKVLEGHTKAATAWVLDQLPTKEVVRTVYQQGPTVYKTVSIPVEVEKRVEVPIGLTFEEKYKLAQLVGFQKIQKYIVDRFYDTPLPTGQKRSLLLCHPQSGCKRFVLPDTLEPQRLN